MERRSSSIGGPGRPLIRPPPVSLPVCPPGGVGTPPTSQPRPPSTTPVVRLSSVLVVEHPSAHDNKLEVSNDPAGIGALVGVDPFNRDSGTLRGKRTV